MKVDVFEYLRVLRRQRTMCAYPKIAAPNEILIWHRIVPKSQTNAEKTDQVRITSILHHEASGCLNIRRLISSS